MDNDGTQRIGDKVWRFRRLRLDVVEGPDTGRTVEPDTDKVTVGTADWNDLELTDSTVSRFHLELTSTPMGIGVVDHGSTNGTFAGSVRVERGFISPGTVLRVGRTAIRVQEAEERVTPLSYSEVLGLVGTSVPMQRLFRQITRAAPTNSSVLVVGESGTGKERIAQALHDLSPRFAAPFEVVDSAALVPTLVASELFGHERGAFTGADRRYIGAFERASGGTLFLDEVGELPLAIQATLLGALERRTIKRLGGRTSINIDVRVVSATHRDLRSAVNDGTFRLDLYYRIAPIVLNVPPLRDRTEDIGPLAEHFLHEAGYDGPLDELISERSLAELKRHRWEGNARELRNAIEALLVLGELPPIEQHQQSGDVDLDQPYRHARRSVLREFEQRYLSNLLARANGNVARAAREAGMDRSYLFLLLRKHHLR